MSAPARGRLTRAACALALAGALADCSGARRERPDPRWQPVVSNKQLAVFADTSRVVRDTAGTRVWLRFDYAADNPPFQDVKLPWRRMEEQERVDCIGRRAQDLRMIVYDTAGAAHEGSDALPHDWKSFETHPLTVMLFEPLCGVLTGVAAAPGRPQ